MTDKMSMSQRWERYRPSKGVWLWSCAGCVITTMIVGFTWGGWVTGGSAQGMADNAAEESRANVLATLCVNRFVAADGAAGELVALKEASSWERDEIIEDGGWIAIKGLDGNFPEAADLCAERLAGMEDLPVPAIDTDAKSG